MRCTAQKNVQLNQQLIKVKKFKIMLIFPPKRRLLITFHRDWKEVEIKSWDGMNFNNC